MLARALRIPSLAVRFEHARTPIPAALILRPCSVMAAIGTPDVVSELDGQAPESTDFANYFCTYAYLYHQVRLACLTIFCDALIHTASDIDACFGQLTSSKCQDDLVRSCSSVLTVKASSLRVFLYFFSCLYFC